MVCVFFEAFSFILLELEVIKIFSYNFQIFL